MFRWLILIAAFAVWAGCMALVYKQCKPIAIEGSEAASRAALDRAFAENAPDQRAWIIFADPIELEEALGSRFGKQKQDAPSTGRHAKREWTGLNESGLVKAGRLETHLKNKRQFSHDEETILKFELPGTELFAHYTGQAHLTFDNGLENCSMALKLGVSGIEFDALSVGSREGNQLNLTTTISQSGQTLYTGRRSENISGNTALTAEIAPFQYKADVWPGQEWVIVLLDFNLALTGEAQGAKPMRVKCTGQTTIILNGVATRALAVHSDDGTAHAWYSPDGVVLKQAYRLAGVLDVALVRDETKQ